MSGTSISLLRQPSLLRIAGAWIGPRRPKLVLDGTISQAARSTTPSVHAPEIIPGRRPAQPVFERTGAPAIWLSSSDRCLFADCRRRPIHKPARGSRRLLLRLAAPLAGGTVLVGRASRRWTWSRLPDSAGAEVRRRWRRVGGCFCWLRRSFAAVCGSLLVVVLLFGLDRGRPRACNVDNRSVAAAVARRPHRPGGVDERDRATVTARSSRGADCPGG